MHKHPLDTHIRSHLSHFLHQLALSLHILRQRPLLRLQLAPPAHHFALQHARPFRLLIHRHLCVLERQPKRLVLALLHRFGVRAQPQLRLGQLHRRPTLVHRLPQPNQLRLQALPLRQHRTRFRLQRLQIRLQPFVLRRPFRRQLGHLLLRLLHLHRILLRHQTQSRQRRLLLRSLHLHVLASLVRPLHRRLNLGKLVQRSLQLRLQVQLLLGQRIVALSLLAYRRLFGRPLLRQCRKLGVVLLHRLLVLQPLGAQVLQRQLLLAEVLLHVQIDVARQHVLLLQILDGLLFGRPQLLHVAFGHLAAVVLLGALLGERLDALVDESQRLLVAAGADYVFEVLEQAALVGRQRFRFHHRNGFDLALQNEEAIVVEIDAVRLEQLADLFEVDAPVVDGVERRVVLERGARDEECGARLWGGGTVRRVDDRMEVDGHLAGADVRVGGGIVQQRAELLAADLLGAVAENEQHRIDDVGLAGAVGSDYGVEALRGGAKRVVRLPMVPTECAVLTWKKGPSVTSPA